VIILLPAVLGRAGETERARGATGVSPAGSGTGRVPVQVLFDDNEYQLSTGSTREPQFISDDVGDSAL